MRLMVFDCEVSYSGRGETFLPRGQRLVIEKDDGALLIHQDKGVKPLNYMTKTETPEEFYDDEGILHFVFSWKQESLDVKVFAIQYDMQLDFDDTQDLARGGTESQIQEWLSDESHFAHTFGENYRFLCREYQTGKGPVDLLGIDEIQQQLVIVEVKRCAKKNDVYQLNRYRTALEQAKKEADSIGEDVVSTGKSGRIDIPSSCFEKPIPILAAMDFKKGAKEEAELHGVKAVVISEEAKSVI